VHDYALRERALVRVHDEAMTWTWRGPNDGTAYGLATPSGLTDIRTGSRF
jgi:hypothetical protein